MRPRHVLKKCSSKSPCFDISRTCRDILRVPRLFFLRSFPRTCILRHLWYFSIPCSLNTICHCIKNHYYTANTYCRSHGCIGLRPYSCHSNSNVHRCKNHKIFNRSNLYLKTAPNSELHSNLCVSFEYDSCEYVPINAVQINEENVEHVSPTRSFNHVNQSNASLTMASTNSNSNNYINSIPKLRRYSCCKNESTQTDFPSMSAANKPLEYLAVQTKNIQTQNHNKYEILPRRPQSNGYILMSKHFSASNQIPSEKSVSCQTSFNEIEPHYKSHSPLEPELHDNDLTPTPRLTPNNPDFKYSTKSNEFQNERNSNYLEQSLPSQSSILLYQGPEHQTKSLIFEQQCDAKMIQNQKTCSQQNKPFVVHNKNERTVSLQTSFNETEPRYKINSPHKLKCNDNDSINLGFEYSSKRTEIQNVRNPYSNILKPVGPNTTVNGQSTASRLQTERMTSKNKKYLGSSATAISSVALSHEPENQTQKNQIIFEQQPDRNMMKYRENYSQDNELFDIHNENKHSVSHQTSVIETEPRYRIHSPHKLETYKNDPINPGFDYSSKNTEFQIEGNLNSNMLGHFEPNKTLNGISISSALQNRRMTPKYENYSESSPTPISPIPFSHVPENQIQKNSQSIISGRQPGRNMSKSRDSRGQQNQRFDFNDQNKRSVSSQTSSIETEPRYKKHSLHTLELKDNDSMNHSFEYSSKNTEFQNKRYPKSNMLEHWEPNKTLNGLSASSTLQNKRMIPKNGNYSRPNPNSISSIAFRHAPENGIQKNNQSLISDHQPVGSTIKNRENHSPENELYDDYEQNKRSVCCETNFNEREPRYSNLEEYNNDHIKPNYECASKNSEFINERNSHLSTVKPLERNRTINEESIVNMPRNERLTLKNRNYSRKTPPSNSLISCDGSESQIKKHQHTFELQSNENVIKNHENYNQENKLLGIHGQNKHNDSKHNSSNGVIIQSKENGRQENLNSYISDQQLNTSRNNTNVGHSQMPINTDTLITRPHRIDSHDVMIKSNNMKSFPPMHNEYHNVGQRSTMQPNCNGQDFSLSKVPWNVREQHGSPDYISRKPKTFCGCKNNFTNQGNLFKMNFPNSKSSLKNKAVYKKGSWRFDAIAKRSRYKIEKYENTKCWCSKKEERNRITCRCFDKESNQNIKCQYSDKSIEKLKHKIEDKIKKTQIFDIKKKRSCKKIDALTCTSTLNTLQDNGCSCCYPPPFKHFTCAGQINGSCDCNENAAL